MNAIWFIQALSSPPQGASSSILQWLQICLAVISLGVIFYGVFKVVNRNNEEWRERERRLAAIEQEITEMRTDGKKIIALAERFVALGESMKRIEDEMGRVRNRLDQFLDRREELGPHASTK
jgi:biopolymer transport protein ExbB/TolQ